MHDLSTRELATWISIFSGVSIAFGVSMGVALWAAFAEPNNPDD